MQNPNGIHNYYDHSIRQRQDNLIYERHTSFIYDSITGLGASGFSGITPIYGETQRIVVTGRRLPRDNSYHFPYGSPDFDYWKSAASPRTWEYTPSTITAPINFLQHLSNLTLGIVLDPDPLRKSVPTNVLQTGFDIFTEMMDRSGRGMPGLSDFAIP
jgi:hypothetical protein